MTDCAQSIAAFIRCRRSADRGALLAAILRRWPDATGEEIQSAIDMSRPQAPSRALEVSARKRA